MLYQTKNTAANTDICAAMAGLVSVKEGPRGSESAFVRTVGQDDDAEVSKAFICLYML